MPLPEGHKSLEQLYDLLGALKWQLEDVNPPGTPEEMLTEQMERWAQDLKRFGLLVPIMATREPPTPEFVRGFRQYRLSQVEIVANALEVVKSILKEWPEEPA